MLYPGRAPAIEAVPGGVKVGKDQITFFGDRPTAGDAAGGVAISRDGREVLALTGRDINLDRSQGDIHPDGNPHYWLDPENGRLMARGIANRLASSSPFRRIAVRHKSSSICVSPA